jgi:hypothetical protein
MATNCESELRACNINCQEYLGGPREQNCISECFHKYGECLVKRKDWWFLVRGEHVPPDPPAYAPLGEDTRLQPKSAWGHDLPIDADQWQVRSTG